MDKEKYFIRVYTFGMCGEEILNILLTKHEIKVVSTISGLNNTKLYDIRCDTTFIKLLMWIGFNILPHNHFEDFEITCPTCGERIDDDMILRAYNNDMLNGYNIQCNRLPCCGLARAEVKFLPSA